MKTRILLFSILAIVMLTSCGTPKDIVYFEDEPIEDGLIMSEPMQLLYKPDDILTINVSALDPETVKPFNLPVVQNNLDDALSANGRIQFQTYLVDYDGNIEFPVLGRLKVEGLTRKELTSLLVERISAMANDPIVNVRLANFTITIIGEVARPGTFTIQDERITLLEAIGLASDLTIYGERKNLLIIREVDGKKKFATVDLTSVNAVNSPVYYLQQNDVIYVEPNKARKRQSTYTQNNVVLISAISTLASITAIIISSSN